MSHSISFKCIQCRNKHDDLPGSLPPWQVVVRTFLERQPFWHELKAKYDKTGEWLRPYSFRNSYSLRAHRLGHRNDVICLAMGHSLSTHENSYEWARNESVLEHV